MKKRIWIILLMITLVLSFVACNGEGGDGQTDSQNATEDGATDGNKTEVDTTGKFSIFMNEEYVCRVICPDKPTDAERSIYQGVRERLKLATKINPEMVTDFKAYNDTGADREKPAILLVIGFSDEDRGLCSVLTRVVVRHKVGSSLGHYLCCVLEAVSDLLVELALSVGRLLGAYYSADVFLVHKYRKSARGVYYSSVGRAFAAALVGAVTVPCIIAGKEH